MSCPQTSTVVEVLWTIDSSPIEGDLCTVRQVGTAFCIANADGSGGLGARDMDAHGSFLGVVSRSSKSYGELALLVEGWLVNIDTVKLKAGALEARATPPLQF